MSVNSFTESVVEAAALTWLESLGYTVKHGPEIAPGEIFAERGDYGQVILATRLREALVRLNPTLPAEAIDDAFRKIIRLEGATLDARNRTFHRLLVDGVTVKHGHEIAPGERLLTRANYGPVMLVAGLVATRAKNALAQIPGNMQKMHIAFKPRR